MITYPAVVVPLGFMIIKESMSGMENLERE